MLEYHEAFFCSFDKRIKSTYENYGFDYEILIVLERVAKKVISVSVIIEVLLKTALRKVLDTVCWRKEQTTRFIFNHERWHENKFLTNNQHNRLYGNETTKIVVIKRVVVVYHNKSRRYIFICLLIFTDGFLLLRKKCTYCSGWRLIFTSILIFSNYFDTFEVSYSQHLSYHKTKLLCYMELPSWWNLEYADCIPCK